MTLYLNYYGINIINIMYYPNINRFGEIIILDNLRLITIKVSIVTNNCEYIFFLKFNSGNNNFNYYFFFLEYFNILI